jgi:3'-phosphoadenosine 5'-phosphosulfate (PAPS) 3'-phosphatase
MRLPPAGYREKIWDHAAGSHFIIEAGGEVTDLSGRRLDFSQGRYLAEDVTGILASNGVLHKKFLEAVNAAKKAEDEEIAAGRKQKRVFGEDSS